MGQIARSMAVCCALLLVLATPTNADFGIGKTAYDRGDYATALRELRPLAEQGNAAAQLSLGVMYATGRGVPQDYTEALRWYRLAVKQGKAEAPSLMGVQYEKGQGMPQEYVCAYTFAAAKNKSNVTVRKPSNFSSSQMWRSIMGNERKTLPAGRKPLPPGWMLVAGEWKIAE